MIVCLTAVALAAGNVVGFAHVAFRVSDLKKAVSFYRRLGFQESFELSKDGKPTESFIKIEDHQFIELYPQTSSSQPLGFMHLCFEVRNIEMQHSLFDKIGGRTTEVRKAAAGNLLFTVQDLEGRVVEFTQYERGSLHMADSGKHLRPDRSKAHLETLGLLVRNERSAEAFYSGALRAVATPGAPVLRIPGSRDSLLLTTQGAGTPAVIIDLEHLRGAREAWRKQGLMDVSSPGSFAILRDPDGNRIAFKEHGRG